MSVRMIKTAIAAMVLLGVFAGRAQAATLYGITFDGLLFTIDVGTGAGTLVGDVGPGTAYSDLAAFGGVLYAYDQITDTFLALDPFTAAPTGSTASGVDVFGEGGLTGSGTTAFLSNSAGATGTLYACNITVASSCASVGGLDPSMDALAMSAGGTLYGLSQSPTGTAQPSLFLINQLTAATTLVGATGVGGFDIAGMAFDPVTAILYAAIGRSLYTVNLGTGAATFVGVTGFDEISGLAFVEVVPEPMTLFLLGTGLAAGLRRRKVSGR